jgi:hypothetical protein
MRQNNTIGIAALALFLGVTVPAFAQKGKNDRNGDEGKGQQHQQQPQHARQGQRQQQAPRTVRSNGNNGFHGMGNNGNHYGRIPDENFHASFGRDHAFRIRQPRFVNGYYRFQYGGYWFGYRDRWPLGWDYSDNIYVDYVGGAYYMYNPRRPGIRITLNLF